MNKNNSYGSPIFLTIIIALTYLESVLLYLLKNLPLKIKNKITCISACSSLNSKEHSKYLLNLLIKVNRFKGKRDKYFHKTLINFNNNNNNNNSNRSIIIIINLQIFKLFNNSNNNNNKLINNSKIFYNLT